MLPFLLALSEVTFWYCNGFDGNSDKRDEENHASSSLSIAKPLHEGEGKAASLTQEKGTAATAAQTSSSSTLAHLPLLSTPRDVAGGTIWGMNTVGAPKQTTRQALKQKGTESQTTLPKEERKASPLMPVAGPHPWPLCHQATRV